MSRKSFERRRAAEERWPTLYQFLAAYCHQDFPDFHGSLEGAIDAAIADYGLEDRQKVLREWRDWNVEEGSQFDPRPAVNEGLGVAVMLNSPEDARHFMNMVYDKVVVSVRAETEAKWKPEWKR
ncbi:contact-dependent growth inhibition system immunity protein [Sphingomonas radiodurans]|uniref:contact-dependent growth inhibition system immunity protein n=1 Tax=Sphingomonas radiodurans TaxID=2890321 RepID=UPI001E6150D2|nr:hypothetical protein [Sphingomonas radiodurans]WBH17715.1 hypothetical protein LLW23_06350 [Sphingomonas radiodurans]